MKQYKEYVSNIFPCLGYGILGGGITGAVIFFFKLAASHLEEWSRFLYSAAKNSPLYVCVVFAVLIVLASVMAFMQKKIPEMKGGGIPRCEGILRGILSFRRVKTFLGTFFGSLISFFCGLPLGSEGPAVIIGASVGGLCSGISKNRSAWSRYIMTGGAGAGFAVATGAPLSAMFFALEEIHKRFTPMLVLTVSSSVLSATYVNKLLCAQFGIGTTLISPVDFPDLELEHVGYLLGLGVIVALAVGAFDVLISLFGKLTKKFKGKIPDAAKLFVVFILTGIMGLYFNGGVYSGHEIIENILTYGESLSLIVILLVIRMFMMILVTDSGATGGIFIPTLAIGALVGALAAKILVSIGMPTALFPTVVILGMCAFMGGVIRAPLTATVIFIEITCRFTNFFYVALVIFAVNFITELLNQQPFYDRVLEGLEDEQNKGKKPRIVSYEMKVSADAFVIGKSVRDIMWPHSSVVVSITRADNAVQDMDHDGEKKLYEGDTVILRSKVFDDNETVKHLQGLVGKQFEIKEIK